MNKVILTGNLCRDIEVRQTASGIKTISNAIAVSRDRKEADGTYASDFINIVVWDKQAEYLESKGHKGDRLEVVGRWQVRKYTDKNGVEKQVNECIVESLTVFAKQPVQQTANAQPVVDDSIEFEDDKDLPF